MQTALEKIQTQIAPAALAVASLGLSLFLTIRLGLAVDFAEGVAIAVVLGVVWETAKYAFAAKAWEMLGSPLVHQRVSGALVMAVACVLVAGSMAATVSGLDAIKKTDDRNRQEKSGVVEATDAMIKSAQEELGILIAAASIDVDNGYRDRALKTQERIETLRRQIYELVQARTAAYGAVSDSYGLVLSPSDGAERTRTIIYCIIAVMLELIGVISVTVLPTRSPGPDAAQYGAIHRAIRSGDCKPSYRAVMERGRLSQEEAKSVLEQAEGLGIVKRVGRGWVKT